MEAVITASEHYVTNLLREDLPHQFVYHNLGHTQRVVEDTRKLIEGEQIPADQAELLILAAWFHDTGYTKGCENHEASSVAIMSAFLKKQGLEDEHIGAISDLILSTKMGQVPESHLEKILNDADNAHFGQKGYEEVSELLREEWRLLDIKSYSDIEWLQENIAFFTQNHNFYTPTAIALWQSRKDKNLAALFKARNKYLQTDKKDRKKDEVLEIKKKRARLPERGVETMFRVTLRNHINLSDIADTKANILLSVNAIIVSLVLANLLPKLDNPSNAHLIYPTIIFVVFTVTAMVLSVLATRPKVSGGQFTKEDVKNKKVNILFFGNFHKMKLDDFEWAMSEVMNDRDYLYSSMSKDLYFLGKVLHRKYRILRITYTIFIIGIIVSCIAFGIAFQYSGN